MAELRYSAEIVGAPPVTGAAELAGGKLELVLPLPEGVLGRVAAELRIDAECYHHLVGLIRANRSSLAGKVLDWFTETDAEMKEQP